MEIVHRIEVKCMPDPTKKPGGDRPNLLEGVKRICRKFKTKLSVLKKGRETSDKKSSIASDLDEKNCFVV